MFNCSLSRNNRRRVHAVRRKKSDRKFGLQACDFVLNLAGDGGAKCVHFSRVYVACLSVPDGRNTPSGDANTPRY